MDADSFSIETYQITDDGTVETIDEAFTIEKTGAASASEDTTAETAAAETGKNYGDAQFVSSEEEDAYFAEAKLSRTKSRDEAAEALSEMLADAELEADQKAELAMKAAELAQSIEIEGKMENLIQAKGFDECMVYYDTDRVDIVVKTDGLTDDEVMQMRDIAIRETSVPVENISIVEINN